MNDDAFVPKLYFLMRLDIPDMNTGKAIAQATHAQRLADTALANSDAYKAWSGDIGFGTAISLECTTVDIDAISDVFLDKKLHSNPSTAGCFGVVFDPTYPFRNTFGDVYTMGLVTCAYLFVHEDTPPDIKDYVANMRLYR